MPHVAIKRYIFITGRSSMHIAVLLEHEEIVDFLASNFRQTLKIGDNVYSYRILS